MTEFEKRNKICFIDSNIWLYAFIETLHKSLIAKSLIKGADITITTQVINEVCVNLIKKALPVFCGKAGRYPHHQFPQG